MNYCDAIRDALTILDENHAAKWLRLTKADIKTRVRSGTAMTVARRLMGCVKCRLRTGMLGIGPGGTYIFHKDRWRRTVRCKNGKHRLEGSLCD